MESMCFNNKIWSHCKINTPFIDKHNCTSETLYIYTQVHLGQYVWLSHDSVTGILKSSNEISNSGAKSWTIYD